jgi:hypothetical protein
MTRHSGKCVGGPWDGQYYVGEAKRIPFYKPALEFSLARPIEDLAVEAVPAGAYVWSGTNFWQWEPT